MLAAFQGHLEVAELLLATGASVNMTDADGMKPHHLADRIKKDPMSQQDGQIGNMLRKHSNIMECEKNIRILQAQKRGPVAEQGVLRNYGLLPPIGDAHAATETAVDQFTCVL